MFPEWYAEAEKMFLEKKTYTEIGKSLSVGRKSISHWLRDAHTYLDRKYIKYVNFAPSTSNHRSASIKIGEA